VSWIDTLRVGDVVRFKSGKLRTVVGVGYKDGKVSSVGFPILVCSWTGRGYTVLARSDLKIRAQCKTIVKIDLSKHVVGTKLLEECSQVGKDLKLVSCCEIVGVIE
jgi:hypothetical protein